MSLSVVLPCSHPHLSHLCDALSASQNRVVEATRAIAPLLCDHYLPTHASTPGHGLLSLSLSSLLSKCFDQQLAISWMTSEVHRPFTYSSFRRLLSPLRTRARPSRLHSFFPFGVSLTRRRTKEELADGFRVLEEVAYLYDTVAAVGMKTMLEPRGMPARSVTKCWNIHLHTKENSRTESHRSLRRISFPFLYGLGARLHTSSALGSLLIYPLAGVTEGHHHHHSRRG